MGRTEQIVFSIFWKLLKTLKKKKMSAIDIIRTNYEDNSDDDEVKETLDRMMSNDEEIELLQSKLNGVCEQRSVMVNSLKRTYLKSASTPEIVGFGMRFFDEDGESLGFENTVLDQIRLTAEDDLNDIVDATRDAVFHLLNDLNSQVPILKRRSTLHILASILQLREFEPFADHMEPSLLSVFDYLCGNVHDWSKLTPIEKEFLVDMTDRLNDVPEKVKCWVKRLIGQ